MTDAEIFFTKLIEKIPNAQAGKMFGALCMKMPNGKSGAMFWKDHIVVNRNKYLILLRAKEST